MCNGQNNMLNYRLLQFRSIREAVNWVCDDALDDHVWVSELTISCQKAKVLEALQYDFANPCMVQWCMLWFSAPTSLNNGFLNNGVILEKYNEEKLGWIQLRGMHLDIYESRDMQCSK